MLYGGIAWTDTGYDIYVVDGTAGRKVADEQFGAHDLIRMIDYISALQEVHQQQLSMVVDSSNGMLDGTLMAAGLDVYRADPWLLPAPADFGSPAASVLAESALHNLGQLARLRLDNGTLTGRLTELEEGIRDAAPSERELTATGHCLSHGSRERRRIALTFDDGPHPLFTGQVLDVLARYGIPATFFCVGLHAGGHPGLVARVSDAGHLLGNHTWSHAFLPDLSKDQLAAQIERTTRQLAANGSTTSLFRPPYGSRTPAILSWLVELETTTVLWDVEPFDWALPGSDVIARRVLADARPGSIVLLHDGGGDRAQTVAALPQIIEGLLSQDYDFVTVDRLMNT